MSEEALERTKFDRNTLNQEKHDNVTLPTSTLRPVCGQESTEHCVLTPKTCWKWSNKIGETRHGSSKRGTQHWFQSTRTVTLSCKGSRTSPSSRACAKDRNSSSSSSTSSRLAAPYNVYNAFSKNSKEMIRELGNVELFELCETAPKVQCSQCLLYWNQWILYCTCGQCLIYSETRRNFHKLRLGAISIPDNVIKKGATHGARPGKTEVQREYHIAWNAWKRCCKKVDSQGEHLTGVHDRFLRDPVYRESQLAIGWSEQKCKEWDELAKEDTTYKFTPEERRRYQGHSYLTLNKDGKNGPTKLRSDYGAAVMVKNRLHHESGEPNWRAHPSRSTKTNTTRTRSFLRRLFVQRSSWPT